MTKHSTFALLALALTACAADTTITFDAGPEPPPAEIIGDSALEVATVVEDELRARGYDVPDVCTVGADQPIAYVSEDDWSAWCDYPEDVYANTVYHDAQWGACSVRNTWIVVDWREHPFDRVMLEIRAALRHFADCAGLAGEDLFYTGTNAAWRSDGTVEAIALYRMTRCEAVWCL